MQKDAGGGGVTITGSNVSTAGGDIVGRDKIQQVSSHQIDNVFDPVCKAIEVVGPSEKAAAEEKLRALKDEAGKGKHADDLVVAKLVEGLCRTCSRRRGGDCRCIREPRVERSRWARHKICSRQNPGQIAGAPTRK